MNALKIYQDIFNKSRFLGQDHYFTPVKLRENNWHKLGQLDSSIHHLDKDVRAYIASLCAFYRAGTQDKAQNTVSDFNNCPLNFNANLKKLCAVYAIGLLICDDLLTRINFLNINNKAARVTIPTISYNNSCKGLSWIANLLQKVTFESDPVLQLDASEIATLNAYAKALTNAYNSSALGIFRKQPVRRFAVTETVIYA